MNDLRWTELAAQVVAWHNRLPLARRIGVQHVHSLGYVMLPFVDASAEASSHGAAPAERSAARATPGGSEPLPPEALTGSLRERAMARAQLDAQGPEAPDAAAGAAAGDPPQLTAPVQLRPAFDEDFIPPLSPKAVRRWVAQHAVAQATPRGDVQVRKVKAEAGVDESAVLPRWVLTAQIDTGRARTRVLVGPGSSPAVLGRRLWSPGRMLGLLLVLAALGGGAAVLMKGGLPALPAAEVPPPAAAASAASAASAAPSAAASSVAVVLPPPTEPAPASAAHTTPAHAAPVVSAPAPASVPVAAPASSPAAQPPAKPTVTTAPPPDVEPQLGKIDLPSLGPRIDERRRKAQEAAASAAAAKPAPNSQPGGQPGTQASSHTAAHPPTGPSFAVATRLLRTRSESEQLAAAMRELLAKQPGPPVRVEVLAAGDDWRVVGWPYTDRALADKAQALLASRGMKVQVIDF